MPSQLPSPNFGHQVAATASSHGAARFSTKPCSALSLRPQPYQPSHDRRGDDRRAEGEGVSLITPMPARSRMRAGYQRGLAIQLELAVCYVGVLLRHARGSAHRPHSGVNGSASVGVEYPAAAAACSDFRCVYKLVRRRSETLQSLPISPLAMHAARYSCRLPNRCNR